MHRVAATSRRILGAFVSVESNFHFKTTRAFVDSSTSTRSSTAYHHRRFLFLRRALFLLFLTNPFILLIAHQSWRIIWHPSSVPSRIRSTAPSTTKSEHADTATAAPESTLSLHTRKQFSFPICTRTRHTTPRAR